MITLFLSATREHSGLTSASLGLLRALDQRGVRIAFMKPISEYGQDLDRSVTTAKRLYHLDIPAPIPINQARQQFVAGLQNRLLDNVMAMRETVIQQDVDIVVVEGLIPQQSEPLNNSLNNIVVKALDAKIIIVAGAQQRTLQQLENDVSSQARLFNTKQEQLAGIIFNKVGAPLASYSLLDSAAGDDDQTIRSSDIVKVEDCQPWSRKTPILGVLEWQPALSAPRLKDLSERFQGHWFSTENDPNRRVQHVIVAARSADYVIPRLLPNTLVITPLDRLDIVLAVALREQQQTKIAGLVLTHARGEQQLSDTMQQLLSDLTSGQDNNFGVILSPLDTYQAARCISTAIPMPMDDLERWNLTVSSVGDQLDVQPLIDALAIPEQQRMSPAAFRHRLVTSARSAKRRIVLPEGDEPRTIQAAIECQRRGIADCILLAEQSQVETVLERLKLSLPEDLTILDPNQLQDHYVQPMVELRKHKSLTPPTAQALLEDTVVLGTMMLAEGDVDGLVSGAVHTTANTIRPALQLIKTAPDANLVSSVFFMGLPEQVMVFGDCAVNPDPDAAALADIAIQSAASAIAMGIEPRIAMISYSTGQSGTGSDVEKVRQATQIARERRPDLIIDGPMQYDAATTPSVAKAKAPNSLVAGKATVLIFPDLNTGNTTYKAVQRSANVISVGPLLQGLAKPVNDLSRGATVEDIVYTIALTAIQAQQPLNKID